eukprot:2412087-Lingulodinium_polyedra.AAC.1
MTVPGSSRNRGHNDRTWLLTCGLPINKLLGLVAKLNRLPKRARPLPAAATCDDVRQLRGHGQ